MPQELYFVVKGKPIAKKRPRFVRRGKFVGTYNPQETEEGRFLWDVKAQIGNRKPIEGPIIIQMTFYMPRPKNHFGSGKNEGVLKKTAPRFHTSTPDLDNLEKFVFDCLNGVVWIDDALVVKATSIKAYAPVLGNESTEITIREVSSC